MIWEFTNDRAISAQIVEIIQKGILSGVYPPGSNMPSVRTLAVEAGVNPNTMQKALAELEVQGLLRTVRTTGRTVTEDERLIRMLKDQAAGNCIEYYFTQMHGLGIERDDAVAMIVSRAQTGASDVHQTSTNTTLMAVAPSTNTEVN